MQVETAETIVAVSSTNSWYPSCRHITGVYADLRFPGNIPNEKPPMAERV